MAAQRPAGRRGELQRLLVGLGGRVQTAPRVLNLAKYVAGPGGDSGPVGPSGDAGREGTLGLGDPAAEPFSHGQVAPGDVFQQPLVLAQPGQGLGRERGRGLGVTACWARLLRWSAISAGTFTRRLAAPPAVGLNGSSAAPAAARSAASSSGSTASTRPAAAASWACASSSLATGPDEHSGQRRQPSLSRRRFAAQAVDQVKLLLDQPGSPGAPARGQRVPDRVIGEPVRPVPGGGVAVQRYRPGGKLGSEARPQQVGEQLVIAPPAARLIQRQQEQAVPLDPLQHRLAARPAGDRVAQVTR